MTFRRDCVIVRKKANTMKTVQSIIENLINGNITDAKEAAQKVRRNEIAVSAVEDFGYKASKALVIALFLKGEIEFQEYCDVMAE